MADTNCIPASWGLSKIAHSLEISCSRSHHVQGGPNTLIYLKVSTKRKLRRPYFIRVFSWRNAPAFIRYTHNELILNAHEQVVASLEQIRTLPNSA